MNLLRPEYVCRPSQVLRRLAYSLGITKYNNSAVTPWGMELSFDPCELHGRALLTLGLTDLRTNEIISRILCPGDIAVDVGANIGIMASLMARCVGETGRVYCFEPHPATRKKLVYNLRQWESRGYNIPEVQVLPYALSSQDGYQRLHEPREFGANSGLARLRNDGGLKSESEEGGHGSCNVETIKFDRWNSSSDKIKLMKIDVEGHEDNVLAGMYNTLNLKLVQNIIFEEHRPLPSNATECLARYGYSCFLIDRTFWGPHLVDVNNEPVQLVGEPSNVLATQDASILGVLRERGWRCLGR